MAQSYLQVSRDAALALTEFSDEFRSALALGDIETWAAANGLVHTTDALKSTFPIPVDAAGYHEFKGDIKYRSLYERSLSMKKKQWQDGVEAPAIEIEKGDFIGWADAPAHMAQEWQRQPNVVVMAMLEANPYLDFYRDADSNTASARALFASDHPFNVLDSGIGSFDNDVDTTVADIRSGKFFDDTNAYFRAIKGPNGKPLGLRLAGGTCLVPPTRENLFKKALELDTVIRAVSNAGVPDATANVVASVTEANMWKSAVKYTVTDESSQADYFYVIAAGKPGLHPWVVMQGASLEEIQNDKSSDFYKRTLKVSVAEIGELNAAAALPHRILRVHITG